MKKLVKNRRHKIVGDLMVCEGGRGLSSNSVVMHLPSGLWKGLCVNFSAAKRKLINMCDEERKDTVVWIHEL